jgi:hypothetical protein
MIWCFWTGDSLMSSARRQSLDILRACSQCEVTLVDKNNLNSFVKKDFPLHKAYELLSDTHRSDYLRSYFMLHYGGGYSDIKPFTFSWTKYFDELNDSDKMFTGFPVMHQSHIPESAGKEARENYNKLISITNFIFKPNTKFAEDWVRLTNNKLDSIYNKLLTTNGNYHPRAITGGVFQTDDFDHKEYPIDYPLSWSELLGDIMLPLQVKYIGSFLNSMPVQLFQKNSYR